jgi:hypothetical protein
VPKTPKYFPALRYIKGETYYYYNPSINDYVEFNSQEFNEEKFNSFEGRIYYMNENLHEAPYLEETTYDFVQENGGLRAEFNGESPIWTLIPKGGH